MNIDESARSATIAAFVGTAIIGGMNFVAVRFSNEELAPMWGASARFLLAGLMLIALALALRWPFPRGQGMVGTMLYGLLNFASFYALMYWALLHTTAGFAAVALAITPLLTILLAAVHGLERLTTLRIVGAFVALAGMAVVFREQLTTETPPLALAALFFAAGAGAEAAIAVKKYPGAHPMTRNGVAMVLGGALLFVLSLVLDETRTLPQRSSTWTAFLYLVFVGSMLMFFLVLYVIKHWTASASTYAFVLTPVVAVAGGSLLAGERVTPTFVVGAVLVLAGVYIGAVRGSAATKRATPKESAENP